MSKPRVAFLGLGIMGGGMASRLLSAGFPLTVYNRNREKTVAFSQGGAVVASSPREAASNAEIIISMVADDVASRSMWLGENGALAGASRGSVLIESSTLTVNWIRELAAASVQAGCEFLDAPVTGTKPHAASGELTFMVGGSPAVMEKARPVLSVLGRMIVHLGPHGSGAMLKLINNFICGVQAASFAEGMALLSASGLNREQALAILLSGAPASPLVKRVSASAESGDYTPNFPLKLMAKDIGYAIDEAAKGGMQLKTASSALEIFKRAIGEGLGDQDFSAVVKSQRHD